MNLDEVCEAFNLSEIGEFSDGCHTFNSLYFQRAVLFAALVNSKLCPAWKTKRHEDGELCFGGGWFLVCIETPAGPYSYHYKEDYWDMFHCDVLYQSKPWDGHTEDDVERLLSI